MKMKRKFANGGAPIMGPKPVPKLPKGQPGMIPVPPTNIEATRKKAEDFANEAKALKAQPGMMPGPQLPEVPGFQLPKAQPGVLPPVYKPPKGQPLGQPLGKVPMSKPGPQLPEVPGSQFQKGQPFGQPLGQVGSQFQKGQPFGQPLGQVPMSKPGPQLPNYAKGGKVSSASSRGDGIAQRGKTRGMIVACGGGYMKGKK